MQVSPIPIDESEGLLRYVLKWETERAGVKAGSSLVPVFNRQVQYSIPPPKFGGDTRVNNSSPIRKWIEHTQLWNKYRGRLSLYS